MKILSKNTSDTETKDTCNNDKYHTPEQALKILFGYDSFRAGQKSVIDSILAGRDAFAVMPTGAGKSVCYQIPAVLLPGITLVVSPLISLMQDQVKALNEAGVPAAFINSSLSEKDYNETIRRARQGIYKIIYIAPERLVTEGFLALAKSVPISMVTVDEAHCISQWGQDFRPSYMKIVEFVKTLEKRPIISAFTATATETVREDIVCTLGLQNPFTLVNGFDRENLFFQVEKPKNKEQYILKYISGHSGDSGIIYCATRKNVDNIYELLKSKGISVGKYHAGMNAEERKKMQDDFVFDYTSIVVATNAFGMGIDKPDVRLVIHLDLPDSIEAYFQEAGRAGRDGAQAYAVLLYQKHDRTRLMKRIPDTFPDKDAIREVYEHICYYYQMAMGDGYNVTREFDLDEFCRNFKHFPVQTDSALHLLERAGYIEYTEEQDNASRIHFLLRRDELYRIHELEAEQEQLIQWVLRSYGGVFSDYVFIDERRIATLSGLTTDQVYHGLLALGRARILHYIPRKKTPYITFSCKRIEKERIVFPSSVYDERKKNFKERIEAMLYYAEEADFCRSKVLLHYFGEKDAQPCEQCDVCRIRKSHPHADATDEQIIALILETLKDGQKHNLSEMTFPGISREKTAQLLHQMIEEETVRIQNGVLFLPRP